MSDLMDRIHELWNDCTRCKLSECGRNGVVVGCGGHDAPDGGPTPFHKPLFIIGEAPGQEEDSSLLPFVGSSGQFLRNQAKEVGVDLGWAYNYGIAYVTNIVGCRPPGNRQPMFDEIDACRPRLTQLVAAVRPKVILLLGSTALMAITGRQGISRNRGKWHSSEWEWKGRKTVIPTIATFHPAYLLRDPKETHLFKSDIREAYDRACEPAPG